MKLVRIGKLFSRQSNNQSSIKKSLVASYRCYDKTNDDEDRDVLKDLSGNGHDIQLYNFAFSGESGYGKYLVNWKNFYKYDENNNNPRAHFTATNSKIVITKVIVGYTSFIEYLNSTVIPSFKIKVTGISNAGLSLIYKPEIKETNVPYFTISEDGIYTLPGGIVSGTYAGGFAISQAVDSCNIVIEQIPDYQGALVSDGVDDYGWCKNFPILTKEKGYTVVIIRKWINDTQPRCLLSTHSGNSYGAFQMDKYSDGVGFCCLNFGKGTIMQSFSPNDIVYQTSLSYNGNIELAKGNSDGASVLNLFRYMDNQEYGSAALYALEIYDRDLTDKEIAAVKARMIAEYESKTGNKYEEETI